ncbi:MAG TPA: transposase family protein [Candidatus Saccharimonadia bacterium]
MTITDPRMERQKAHSLIDIIMIAICAVIAGCDDWIEIADFGGRCSPRLEPPLTSKACRQLPLSHATTFAALNSLPPSSCSKRFGLTKLVAN